MAKPTLYAYVGSKAKILEAVFDHFPRLADDFISEAAAHYDAPARRVSR